MAAVGDHCSPTEGDYAPGVYRVVGATDGVTLLRVADVRGRRWYTGETVTVSAGTLDAEFDPASDPDAGATPITTARNVFQGLYWGVRRFLP